MRLLPGQLYSRLYTRSISYTVSYSPYEPAGYDMESYYILGVTSYNDYEYDNIVYYLPLLRSRSTNTLSTHIEVKNKVYKMDHHALCEYLRSSGYILVDVGDTTWVSEI